MEDIFFVLILFVSVLLMNKHIRWWIKLLYGVYYIPLIYFFSRGYDKIAKDREEYVSQNPYSYTDASDVQELEAFWDLRSDYVDQYHFFFHFPLLVLIIYSYYQWIKHASSKRMRYFIIASILPVFVVYLWLTLMVAMLGYQP
jgi:hypothetical protein